MTPNTETKILERVIEIEPNSRYIAVVTSTSAAELEDEVPYLRDMLSNWWMSGKKFLVLGRTDGVDVVFHKVGAEENETS